MGDLFGSYWEELLNRQPGRVRARSGRWRARIGRWRARGGKRRARGGKRRAAYATLSEEEQRAALAHLKRMASETAGTGKTSFRWHPEQVKPAASALAALEEGAP